MRLVVVVGDGGTMGKLNQTESINSLLIRTLDSPKIDPNQSNYTLKMTTQLLSFFIYLERTKIFANNAEKKKTTMFFFSDKK
jgi:hypothetical protein